MQAWWLAKELRVILSQVGEHRLDILRLQHASPKMTAMQHQVA
jgi:hypothetical protein